MTRDLVVLAAVVLVVVLAVVAATVLVRRQRRRREMVTAREVSLAAAVEEAYAPGAQHDPGAAPRPLCAVVINPSKFEDVGPLRAAIERGAADAGWATPLWFETTAEDPGIGQARAALDAGAEIVLACGGDGTVRCVGQVLAGSGVPIGLVPAGTGNLLARNLEIVTPRGAEMTPGDAAAATRVALTGEDRSVDVGWVTVIGADGEEHGRPEERAFLVMAGMGFDAAIMQNAPEALKARVGPAAYVVSGLQHFRGTRTRVTLTIDGESHSRRVRTVVVGNVGRLQGGLALLPDAEVDDGWLDVVAIGPRNLAQWVEVTGRVITRHHRGDGRLQSWRAREITLVTDVPQPAQLDGDPIGDVRELRMRVDERVLLVRVTPGAGAKAPAPGEVEAAKAGVGGR